MNVTLKCKLIALNTRKLRDEQKFWMLQPVSEMAFFLVSNVLRIFFEIVEQSFRSTCSFSNFSFSPLSFSLSPSLSPSHRSTFWNMHVNDSRSVIYLLESLIPRDLMTIQHILSPCIQFSKFIVFNFLWWCLVSSGLLENSSVPVPFRVTRNKNVKQFEDNQHHWYGLLSAQSNSEWDKENYWGCMERLFLLSIEKKPVGLLCAVHKQCVVPLQSNRFLLVFERKNTSAFRQ